MNWILWEDPETHNGVTANGEVQTNEEAQVYVHDLDLFVTVQLLDETPGKESFVQNTDIQMSGKTVKHHVWHQMGKNNHLYNGQCRTSCRTRIAHPILTHILRAELLEFLAHCCSNSSQTCLIHEKFWPRSEYCLCSKTKFWSQLHTYRANN